MQLEHVSSPLLSAVPNGSPSCSTVTSEFMLNSVGNSQIEPMDPAESIFSMLGYSSNDPLLQDDVPFSNNFQYGFDDFLGSEFNMLSQDNNFLGDILFGDNMLTSMDSNAAPLGDIDLFQSGGGNKNFSARSKSKLMLSPIKKSSHSSSYKSFSILNSNSTQANKSSSSRVTISMNVPKVYISPASRKSATASGTSILVKSKKAKRRSLLQLAKESPKFEDIFSKTETFDVTALLDHDYCIKLKDDKSLLNARNESVNNGGSKNSAHVKNDLEDIFQGFVPDDVLLNEVPNCLKDLMNLDPSFMLEGSSEDILHGLTDACNLMTDHYIDDLEQFYDLGSDMPSLPNLDITEDDLNEVISKTESTGSQNGFSDESVCVAKDDIEVDIVYSPFTESEMVDSFDCMTTVSTEESSASSSEDIDCLSRSPNCKRNRSLSGSALTSRRKRRFSSRSSLNSSESDSSSIDSAPSSRSSSPERTLNLSSFGPFSHSIVYSKNANCNRSNFNLLSKNRNRKQLTWSDKFSNNKYLSACKKPVLKKKMKVIDLTHRSYAVSSGLSRITEAGSSHAIGGGIEMKDKVLYIGDITNASKKSSA